MKKRCVIVSAAPIHNYEKIKTFLASDDFYIFCDGGLYHQEKLDKKPDLIIGDFDSHKKPKSSAVPESRIIELPHRKDDTDTFFAVKEALKLGYKDFLLLGVIGARFDHSICNLSAMLYLYNRNCHAIMIDDFSEMQIVGQKDFENNKPEAKIYDSFSYFSLMNIAGNASGITIKGAEYNLENAAISTEYQYGISNKVPKGSIATVSVKNGCMLLVKIW